MVKLKNNSNLYRAFGLNIFSEIPAYSWLKRAGQGVADINIRLGKIANTVLAEGGHFVDNKLLVNINGVARYLIADGSNILVEPESNAIWDDVVLFLFGPAMASLLQQRNYLTLHACGVVINGGVNIFLGDSGIGKSTLAAAFSQYGYPIIADDVCAIGFSAKGEALVYPGYPHIKLWQQAADILGIKTDTLQRVWPGDDKYFLPLNNNRQETPLPIHNIFILDLNNEDRFLYRALNGAEKLVAIKQNTYRHEFVGHMKLSEQHFQHCIQLATKTPAGVISRPQKSTSIRDLLNFVLNLVGRG